MTLCFVDVTVISCVLVFCQVSLFFFLFFFFRTVALVGAAYIYHHVHVHLVSIIFWVIIFTCFFFLPTTSHEARGDAPSERGLGIGGPDGPTLQSRRMKTAQVGGLFQGHSLAFMVFCAPCSNRWKQLLELVSSRMERETSVSVRFECKGAVVPKHCRQN